MSSPIALPVFRYHPDPVASSSVMVSNATCRCCNGNRGWIYAGPVYSESELDDSICPWCIADGSAHRRFGATFVDIEALADDASELAKDEITTRTPGYSTWQSESWPSCCGEPAAFLLPAGIAEIRANFRELESQVVSHVIYELKISGGAALRYVNSLSRDQGPTAYIFKCGCCEQLLFTIDAP